VCTSGILFLAGNSAETLDKEPDHCTDRSGGDTSRTSARLATGARGLAGTGRPPSIRQGAARGSGAHQPQIPGGRTSARQIKVIKKADQGWVGVSCTS